MLDLKGFVACCLSLSISAECNIQTSPSPGIQVRHVYTPSTTKHFSPIKQSTTLTNKHRGNEVSSTPLLVHCRSSEGNHSFYLLLDFFFFLIPKLQMLIHFNFLPALSIHQLAAQGEMVFLASRIEQGGWNYDKFFKNTLFTKRVLLQCENACL